MATHTPVIRTNDPIRDLNNHLQNVEGQNLTKHLIFTSEQEGKNNEAVHTGTFTFRDATIGKGIGTSKNRAKRHAAEKALDFFDANGIPE